MISKELLGEVFNQKILCVKDIKDGYLNYKYRYMQDEYVYACINIYELAHKCKEWALDKGYKLLDECHAIIITDLNDIEINIIDDDFNFPYKLERVFKACHWILDNQN